MYDIVVKISNSKGYIKVEGHNLIIVPDIQSASKFSHLGCDATFILAKAKSVFVMEEFEIVSYPESDFGIRPRNTVKRGLITNDSYFCTNCS